MVEIYRTDCDSDKLLIICSLSVSGWGWCFASWGLCSQQCLMWVLTFYYMHKATKRPGAPESNLRCRSDRGAVWGARPGWFSGIFKLVHWGLGQLLFDTHSHMHVAFINPPLVAVFLVLFNTLALSSAPPCKQSYCIIRFIYDAHLFLYNWYKYCICTFLFYKPVWKG